MGLPANLARPGAPGARDFLTGLQGEARLRWGVENLADQLCLAVDGNFDFLVRSPVEDETTEKLAMLVNFVLDTARRGMSALREHNEVLAQLDQAKTVFFSNASHELRTPLTLILGPLGDALAAGGPLEGEALRAAHRNAARLLRLVNALLDFSRIEAGRIEARPEPTDLAALTADIAAVFRSTVENAGLVFRLDCAPARASVDREMWERIVLNLLSNAFKFTFEGEIAVRLRSDGEHVVLQVSDTGVGIAQAELPRLFERFHRVEAPRARTHEGFGIGLAMIHELVKLHGGRIDVESSPGTGTTFAVTIPVGAGERAAQAPSAASANPASRALVEEAAGWGETSVRAMPSPEASDAASMRILVADDNPDMRAYVSRILGTHWRVETFEDGAAALAAARARPPDLMVCDVMMPNLGGFELLRELRADERTRLVPVILLSARAGQEAMVDGFEAGAEDYLVKPFSARELVARVRTHIEISRLRVEAARLYERERSARAEAEAASRAKDEFLAMLSHELRNPLAPIVTALHIMELKGDETMKGERAVIRRQLNHVTRLVDDLLDVSRIMRGRLKLEVESVDIARAVAKGVEIASPILEERGHRLEANVPQGLIVRGDLMRLAQVLSNLLTNAAKYTDPGGTIDVRAGPRAGHVEISVRDNGIGIAPEALRTIFDLFAQGSQSIDRSRGGLGLGLAIVRNLVHLHGGTVEARSDGPGKGSEFVVRLPLAPRRQDDEVEESGQFAALAPTRSPQRVLIVDDNVDAARALSAGLTLLGHSTRVAPDGPSGLAAVREFRPAIAFLDIGLPVMDGYELARQIRALGPNPPRLVAITGYGASADRENARLAGFVEHLVKPVELGTVCRLIERLCATPQEGQAGFSSG